MLAVAQNVQPMAQPTWLETHSVTRCPERTRRGICTASTASVPKPSTSFEDPSADVSHLSIEGSASLSRRDSRARSAKIGPPGPQRHGRCRVENTAAPERTPQDSSSLGVIAQASLAIGTARDAREPGSYVGSTDTRRV